MIKERYWAVRIGKPRRDRTYLQVDETNKEAPGLYGSPDSAFRHLPKEKETWARVVRVEVREI